MYGVGDLVYWVKEQRFSEYFIAGETRPSEIYWSINVGKVVSCDDAVCCITQGLFELVFHPPEEVFYTKEEAEAHLNKLESGNNGVPFSFSPTQIHPTNLEFAP